MEQFDLMYDGIKQLCMFEGEVFGFPEGVNATYMTYDTSKLSALGIDAKDVNTFEDLFDLDDKFNKNSTIEGGSSIINYYSVDYILTYNLLISNYNFTTHYIDFAEIDLSGAKTIYKELYTREIASNVWDAKSFNDREAFYKPELWIGRDDHSFDKRRPKEFISKPLYLNDDYQGSGNPVTISFISISPYSSKIDLAADFVADYAKHLKVSNQPNGEYGRYSDFIYKDLDTYLNRELDLKPIPGVTEEELRYFDKIYENSNLLQIVPGYEECAEILMSYYNDEIGEDEASAMMQDIMNIVYEEYTLNSTNN